AGKTKGAQSGAQNLQLEANGASTGEISTSVLSELGCKHVIIGHSERRAYVGATDAIANKKVKKTISAGLIPILCVGEVLSERKDGIQNEIVKSQLSGALKGLANDEIMSIVVAYEPVWAIGTGETASPEQAQEMHAYIRSILADL